MAPGTVATRRRKEPPQDSKRSLTASAVLGLQRNLGYIGAHIALLAGAVGFLFLQRYIWLLQIAQRGYGPYQTVSYITGLSAVWITVDVLILWWLRGSRAERIASLLWPGFFFASALIILLLNNL